MLAAGLTDETRLPFAPRLVTLFHVLEHLEAPGRALRHLAQLMDPQGWLVLEVPDIEADWRAMGLIQIHVSHRSYFTEGHVACPAGPQRLSRRHRAARAGRHLLRQPACICAPLRRGW